MLFRLLLSASFLVVAMIFSLVIFCHFLSHAYQINFVTCEDGGELISFTTLAWVWRGIHIVDAFIIPSTCIRERDIVIALLVRVCVCLCVST